MKVKGVVSDEPPIVEEASEKLSSRDETDDEGSSVEGLPSLKRKRMQKRGDGYPSLTSLCYEELSALAECETLGIKVMLKVRNDLVKFLDRLDSMLSAVRCSAGVSEENMVVLEEVLVAKNLAEIRKRELGDSNSFVKCRIKIGDEPEVVKYLKKQDVDEMVSHLSGYQAL